MAKSRGTNLATQRCAATDLVRSPDPVDSHERCYAVQAHMSSEISDPALWAVTVVEAYVALALATAAYLAWVIVLKPWKMVQFVKKQGVMTMPFRPLIGNVRERRPSPGTRIHERPSHLPRTPGDPPRRRSCQRCPKF